MCPYGRRLLGGTGRLRDVHELVCHCLVIESEQGLVLVDTGYGLDAIADPESHIGPFRSLGRPRLDPAETAIRQIEAMGHSASDVRHILLTHLDLDHAGGLRDFPRARVHLMRAERDAAANPRTFGERRRYRPVQWSHDPDWALYDEQGEPWHGFGCVRALDGLPPEILLVPLAGHSRGHSAVAVDTGAGWLLHAGDAYFFRDEVDPWAPWCPPGLRLFQTVVATDRGERIRNQRRLSELVRHHGHEVRIFCAHDSRELSALERTAAQRG